MRWALALLWMWCSVLLAAPASANPTSNAKGAQGAPLIDQSGRTFTLRSLRGKPVVLTFVATRCTDACPIANAVFIQLQRQLRAATERVRLLTITLDPSYDTPFVMSREAQALGADRRLWLLASGSPHDVEAVMRAFGVIVDVTRSGIPEEHSTLIYVLDRHGRVAKRLLLGTDTVPEVLAAISDVALR